jgi:hypothetical protein
MGEGKYSPVFEMLTAESSNQYRLVMLDYFEAAEKRGQPEAPPDEDGKPMVYAKLKGLPNEAYWKFLIGYYKQLEDKAASELKKAHGELGLPQYRIGKLFRDGDTAYVLAERAFRLKSDIKMPYQVIEFKLVQDQWQLVVPRDLIWQTVTDTSPETKPPEK